MSIFKEVDIATRAPDAVRVAMNECSKRIIESQDTACDDYMGSGKLQEFAVEIAKQIKQGKSYHEAKNLAFDETQVPPNASPCCNAIRAAVDTIIAK